MPRLRRRYIDPENPYGAREGIDWAQAAASGISGFTGGFVQGRGLRLAEQREERYARQDERAYGSEMERIQEAAIKAAEKKARQDALSGLVEEFRPEQPDPVFEKVRSLTAEMEPERAVGLLDEFGYLAKRKALSEGFARTHGRIVGAMEDGVLDDGRGQEMLKALQSGKLNPGVIDYEINSLREMAAEKETLIQNRDEGLAMGQQIVMAAKNRPSAQINAAKKILALWNNGDYRTQGLGELEGALYDALGSGQRPASPQVRMLPPGSVTRQEARGPALDAFLRAVQGNPDRPIAEIAAALQINLDELGEDEIAALEQALAGGAGAGSR